MWVRGLKHDILTSFETTITSHPMWVRGLKQNVASNHYYK